MADVKITALAALTAADPINDVIPIVDVNDPNMAASGTTKQISINNLLSSSPTASGALTVTGLVTAGSATITGDLTVDTSTLKVDSTNNRVGIGTASPASALSFPIGTVTAVGMTAATAHLAGNVSTLKYGINDGGGDFGGVHVFNIHNGTYSSSEVGIFTGEGGVSVPTQRMRIDKVGDVNISTGNVVMATSGKGIDFAATTSGSGTMTSELLNDYEEGTWVPQLKFGGANVGMTPPFIGRYTKVGRAVTVNGLLNLSNKGSSTGAATITGLPFTSANAAAEYTAVSLRFGVVSFLNVFQGYVSNNSTTIEMEQITIAGAVSPLDNTNFSNSSVVIVNFTYTV